MDNPLFEICAADTSVQSLLGDGKTLRIFDFDYAEQGTKSPYATCKLVHGSPENYLGDVPDCDWTVTKVSVHGEDPQDVLDAANAIRAAIEHDANVTGWIDKSFNPTTKRYVFVFLVDWIVER